MDQYKGLDVLRADPDNSDGLDDEARQGFDVIDPGTGVRHEVVAELAPSASRGIAILCDGRAAVADMRAFIDRRKGRAVPFWLPTNAADLVPNGTTQYVGNSVYIYRRGYHDALALGYGRAHLLFKFYAGTEYYTGAVASTDLGQADGRELVTLVSALNDITQSTTRISFMRYCRLGEDEPTIEWLAPRAAVVRFTAVEVAAEAPAP